jgi:hypothetical protein
MKGQARSTNPAGVWLALVLVMFVVAGLAGIAVLGHASTRTGAAAGALLAPTRISTPIAAGLSCPTDAEFSPDGARIIVVGTLGPCDSAVEHAGHLTLHAGAIFDARSGALVRLIQLEPLLGLSTASQPVWLRPASVHFFSLGWSPDDQHVAITYTVFDSATRLTPDHLLDAGLLVVDTRSGTATIIHGDSGYFATVGATTGFPVWNVATGTEISASAPAELGLTYSWANKSAPAPLAQITGTVSRLPRDAGAHSPVGNPTGGTTFTIWQPGIVAGPQRTSLGGGHAVFLTDFATWAPDGVRVTYLSAGVTLPSPQAPSSRDTSPAAATLPLPTPTGVAQAPARDAALDAVQRQVGAGGLAQVAWNPSGNLLASIACHQAVGSETVVIRDAANGNVLSSASLALGPQDASCGALSATDRDGAFPNLPLTLQWTPGGDALLVCDRAGGMLTVWPVAHGALS